MLENRARLDERDACHRRHGYDGRAAVRFVVACAPRTGGRVLEIGTGQGRFLIALAKRCRRVVTVDLDGGEQRVARLNAAYAGVGGRVRFVVADAGNLPFDDESFDAVLSMNALHHIRDLGRVLAEMMRVIRPGGTIVLADLSAGGLRIFERIHREEGRVHERFPYRWDRVRVLLRRAGCRVRRMRGCSTESLVAVAARSGVPPRTGML